MEIAAEGLLWKPLPKKCQPQRHKEASSCGRRKSDYKILKVCKIEELQACGDFHQGSSKYLMLDKLSEWNSFQEDHEQRFKSES